MPGARSSLVTSDYLVTKNRHNLPAPRKNGEIVAAMLRAKNIDDHYVHSVRKDRGMMFDLIDSKYRTSYGKIQTNKSNRLKLLTDEEISYLKRATNKTTQGKGKKMNQSKQKQKD